MFKKKYFLLNITFFVFSNSLSLIKGRNAVRYLFIDESSGGTGNLKFHIFSNIVLGFQRCVFKRSLPGQRGLFRQGP